MTYDAKNRLTRWQGNVISAKDYAYTYDEIDNRLTDTETGVVRTWTYDASSRLTTMTNGSVTTTFTFDTNGCSSGVNEGGALTTMSYDKENRMVTYADGSGTTASVYNGTGQKVKQGATTLVWDGWDYLGEVNGGTFDCETFTVDGQILAEKRTGTERLDFERTALGSVCTKYDQTNQARAGVQRYKPYGSLEFHDSTLPTWQWVGSWGYRPTGLSWSDYYVRARHYGTQEAQWTTVDPLWPRELTFGYAICSPLTAKDMTGLSIKPNCGGRDKKLTSCCESMNTLFSDTKNYPLLRSNIINCMKKPPFLKFTDGDIDFFLDLLKSYCKKSSDITACIECPGKSEIYLDKCMNPCLSGFWGYATCVPADLMDSVPQPPTRCGDLIEIGNNADEFKCCDDLIKQGSKKVCNCRIVLCDSAFDNGLQSPCSIMFHELSHCSSLGHAGGEPIPGNRTDMRDEDFIYRLACCVCRSTVGNCGNDCDSWDR